MHLLIRAVSTYGCETWTLKESDQTVLGCFERKVEGKFIGLAMKMGLGGKKVQRGTL